MNLEIYSDLHLEMDRNQGRKFMHHMDPEGTDVLILAGDITVHKHMRYVIRTICEKYAPAPVVYVCGNHEFYGSNRPAVVATLLELMMELPNFHWLDHAIFEHEGIKFAGTSLWFKDDPLNIVFEEMLNDFTQIKGYKSWVYEENRKARTFLRENMGKVDVVVTHHAPSMESIHPQYRSGSEADLNRFYYTEFGWDLADDQGPKLWIHGHTHHGCDYVIGRTRVYSNPKGYPNQSSATTGYRGKSHLTL